MALMMAQENNDELLRRSLMLLSKKELQKISTMKLSLVLAG
jgi:hypothetical protein